MVEITEKNKVQSYRTVQAERKNRREKAQLELRIRLLERERQHSRFLVRKEKKEIFKSLKVVRTTTGQSTEAVSSNFHDKQVVSSDYYKRGQIISEIKLKRWRTKEDFLARTLGRVNIGLVDKEDESERQRVLNTLLEEIRHEAGINDSEVESRSLSDINVRSFTNKVTQIPIDVFSSLKQELDLAYQEQISDHRKPKQGPASCNSEFSIKSWLDFESLRYANRVSVRPKTRSTLTRRVRPASAIELGQKRRKNELETGRTSASHVTHTKLDEKLFIRINSKASLDKGKARRHLSASCNDLKSLNLDKEENAEKPSILKLHTANKHIIVVANDSFPDRLCDEKDISDADETIHSSVLEQVKEANEVSNYVSDNEETISNKRVHWSTDEKASAGVGEHDLAIIDTNESSTVGEGSAIEPYQPLKKVSPKEMENSHDLKQPLRRKYGSVGIIPSSDKNSADLSALKEFSSPSVEANPFITDERNRKISQSGIKERKVSSSQRTISNTLEHKVSTVIIPTVSWVKQSGESSGMKRIEHKPLIRRVSFEQRQNKPQTRHATAVSQTTNAPPERKVSVRSRAVLSRSGGHGEVALQLDATGNIRTDMSSAERKESSSQNQYLDMNDPRMPQWRRDMMKEAPPSAHGPTERVKFKVAISKKERQRQLEKMVEDNVSNLRDVIIGEKDRRHQSRQAIMQSLAHIEHMS